MKLKGLFVLLCCMGLNASAQTPFNKPFGHGSFTSTNIKIPICTNGTVNAAVVRVPRLYIGGNFTVVGRCTGGGIPLNTASGLKADAFDWRKIGIVGTVNAVISDGSGGWYVGGDFTTVGNTLRNHLVKITSSYTVDAGFNANLDGTVSALWLNGSTLYIGGNFFYTGSTARPYLASVNAATGSANASFNAGLAGTVSAVELSGSNLYVGGSFTGVNSPYVGSRGAAMDVTTALANTAFPLVNGQINAVISDGSGGWYIGGLFTRVGTESRNNLAHINSSGAVTAFNPNMNNTVIALALSGTTLYAGGVFATVNGSTTRNSLAAIDTTTGTATAFNPNMNSDVNALALSGTTLYAGGDFTAVNGGTQLSQGLSFIRTSDGKPLP